MTTDELQERILDAIGRLQEAHQAHATACRVWAETQHAYRKAKARVHLETRAAKERVTDKHVDAIVDEACQMQMFEARLGEGKKEASYQGLLSVRAELSALQSLLRNNIEEAAATRYGQTAGA